MISINCRKPQNKKKRKTYSVERKCCHIYCSLGFIHFLFGLVDYVHHLPKGHLKFLEKILEEVQVTD